MFSAPVDYSNLERLIFNITVCKCIGKMPYCTKILVYVCMGEYSAVLTDITTEYHKAGSGTV